jgi:hypothetical protein
MWPSRGAAAGREGPDPRPSSLTLRATRSAAAATVTTTRGAPPWLTSTVGIAASSAVLVAMAIVDTMGERDHAPSMLG